ncbi:ABC transporter substrate-binding protein [Amphritea balenae]|uniref:Thiamine pyrimidine synthase n=1 Tax=Amphritea balenae TaxID=452629 RepID=A0A3P1SJR0_9GAMM|nr:ABC transporter substrate-binding protein [Amphritea balenae]RRC97109.1 hypothetical protein EHS89_19360 [Amphritea balenae]GGK68074.1 myristoyl transferase [Amphritea balenae]
MRMRVFVVFLFLFVWRSVAAVEQISVQLDWKHHASYGGIYAALAKGFYTDEGLDVTLKAGGPNVDWVAPVVSGESQLGIGSGEALLIHRSQGLPVKALAASFRRSPVVFFSLADFGIKHPSDFIGKKIRVAPNLKPALTAMLSRFDITPDQYETVVMASNLDLVLRGDVPIWGAYITGLTQSVMSNGHKVNLIFPDNYGVHSYARVIYSTEKFIAEKPEVVFRFLRATLKGWEWAVENSEKVGELVKRHNPAVDRVMQNQAMAASIPLVHTGENRIGSMSPKVWENIASTLELSGVLEKGIDPVDVYTLEFLRRIYGP